MRNTVTRSMNKIVAHAVIYKDGKIEKENVLIPCGFSSCDLAEKYIRKNPGIVSGKLVTVEAVEKVSKLYGMDESLFISLAKPVAARSKETRNDITKTVKARKAELLYMTSDYKVERKSVVYSCDEKPVVVIARNTPKDCKGITLENIENLEILYTLSEEEFFKNARAMKDHQHYE